jgi:Anti-sigma-28 factor, FlgM
MKINNSNDLGAISAPGAKGTAGVESGVRRDGGRGVENTGPDRAELSGLAGKISKAVGRDAVNRAGNVEQLRGQVADGSYRPDPAAISRGIVNAALTNATAGSSKK